MCDERDTLRREREKCPACGFNNWDGKNGETFGLTAPTESTLIEVPTMGGRCEECHHLFSPADLAAEIPNKWGHPCHAANCRKLACESHRKPEQVEPTTEQPITKQAERLDFDQDESATADAATSTITRELDQLGSE